MAIPILVLGDSGTGKTTSLRKFDPVKTLLIQSTAKRLPFRSSDWTVASRENPNGSIVVTDDYDRIHKIFKYAPTQGKNVIIVDDSNYLMQNEEMRRCEQTGYQKFTQMAKNYWQLIDHAQKLAGDTRIYFLMHTQTDVNGIVTPKTTGKLLDEKIVISGLYTIVLRCHAQDGRHYFTTRTSGNDPVKTPLEMFDAHEIDNDLQLVDETIQQFYNLEY